LKACAAIPTRDNADVFTSAATDGTPACLLTWVEGVAADKVVSNEGGPGAVTVLRGLGEGMARLHSVPVPTDSTLRTISDGGGCDVRMHVNNEIFPVLQSSPHTRDHEFVPFYERQLVTLKEGMALELPSGVLHGDPFLDSVLVDPAGGSFSGFVDLEDVAVGPLLFDFACCASACCFRSDNTLDTCRLKSLIEGYTSVRRLTTLEETSLVDFMRLTMLCNCTWRFKHFNIDHREAEECRNAYVELQRRNEHLELSEVIASIGRCLEGVKTLNNS